jgi:hypothetical protein
MTTSPNAPCRPRACAAATTSRSLREDLERALDGTDTVTDFSTTRSLVSCVIRLSFLSGFLEGRERVLPEALEVLAQLGERVAVDAVVVARALLCGPGRARPP